MNNSRKNIYEKNIIQYLLKNPKTSAKQISIQVGLSEKTVRLYLKEINSWLLRNNYGFILFKRGRGITLKTTDNQGKQISDLLNSCMNQEFVESIEILKLLLNLRDGDSITKIELANSLYESVSTLNRSLTSISRWLEKQNIRMVILKNKGISIWGSEFNKRQAIKSLIVEAFQYQRSEELLDYFTPSIDKQQIEDVIKKAENEWSVQFTKKSFFIIKISLCISLSRIKHPLNDFHFVLEKTDFYNEYNFSEYIFQLLENLGHHYYSKEDIEFVALEIITADKIKWSNSPAILKKYYMNQDFDQDLIAVVNKFIASVSTILGVNINNDQRLSQNLTQHLRIAIFRMKYGNDYSVNHSIEVRKKYKNVYSSVLTSSMIIEDHYHVSVTDSELSYLCLYIEAALLRRKQQVGCILVTNLGRAQRLFTVELIKHYIPQIAAINVMSTKTLSKKNISSKVLILSTEDIDYPQCIKINPILDSKDIADIQKWIENFNLPVMNKSIFSKNSQTLFNIDLLQIQSHTQNKFSLIYSMTQKMEQMGKVKSGFFKTVYSREQTTSTGIGSSIAIPHGDMKQVNESCVCCATLYQPINWFNEEKVQIIFLLATKMNNAFEENRTKDFFRDLVNFSENQEYQKIFLKLNNKKSAFNFLMGLTTK